MVNITRYKTNVSITSFVRRLGHHLTNHNLSRYGSIYKSFFVLNVNSYTALSFFDSLVIILII